MARQYNIAERLMQANQKPTVMIDEEHVYKINNTTPAAMMIDQLQNKKELSEFEVLEKIVVIALGEEAANYIKSLDLTMPAYTMVINTIMAALADEPLETIEEMEAENRFPEKGKDKGKRK